MTKACVFCAIVSGETKAHVVLDDDVALGFLDTSPLFQGHVLVVPKTHVGTLPELADTGPFFERVKLVSSALPKALGAQGTFVAMNNLVSQSVPHLHVHVVPRTKGDGLKGFFWPRTRYPSDERMTEVASAIREALGRR